MKKIYLVVAMNFRDREPDEALSDYLSDAAVMAETRLSHPPVGVISEGYPTRPDATAYESRNALLRDVS